MGPGRRLNAMAHADSKFLGTSASIAGHLIMLGLVTFGLAQARRDGPTAIVPIEKFDPGFFNRPGRLGRGGAGGADVAAPARPAEIPIQSRREITPVVRPADVPPDPALSIPATTV